MTIPPLSSIGNDYASVARNYAVSNQSDVSSVYLEKMKGVSNTDKVELASPVQYPNADVRAKQVEKTQNAIGAEQSFNNVASKFRGAMTSYNMDAVAQGYGMSGSTINLMA